ncbi:MAG: thymidylate kinase [Planctomycetes bacterium]|nr:thymidylate kinase [Planctomycetota bacterium]
MWIDFEGIDGSGKTSVSRRVAHRLRSSGMPVLHPRENGTYRSRIGARLREVGRDAENLALAPETEFLLGAARESQVLAEEIRPALARNQVVITDRALHTHIAVADFVRALGPGPVRCVAGFAARRTWPDLVIFLDVDPDVARLRRRLRKIRERRFGPSGRKRLFGESFDRRMREAYSAMAILDSDHWRVLETSTLNLDETESKVLALLPLPLRAPSPSPAGGYPAGIRTGRTANEWIDGFFDFAEVMVEVDPAAAALLVAGLDHPRADGIREAALEPAPDVAAWSASGLASPASWRLREAARRRAPDLVARSLVGRGEPAAWRMRLDLEREAPEHVLHSLAGMADPEAHEMRNWLWSASPDEALRGLGGLDDPVSWALRHLARGDRLRGALADSVAGLPSPDAWTFRDEVLPDFPISVLRSLRGLDDERAWTLRREMAPMAPAAVLRTVRGMSSAEAARLRDELKSRCPDEAAASLAGVDTAEAWKLRRELRDESPAGVLDGLAGLEGDPRAIRLCDEILEQSGGRPRLVRKAVRFHLSAAPAPARRE